MGDTYTTTTSGRTENQPPPPPHLVHRAENELCVEISLTDRVHIDSGRSEWWENVCARLGPGGEEPV